MAAALKGHIAALKALLQSGANIHARDKDGYTALMFAQAKDHAQIIWELQKTEDTR